MPCRKEDYIFLEQSVSVDSSEVDALVSRIGEALQLHNNNNNNNSGGGGGGAHQKTVSVSCLHGLSGRPEAVLGGGVAGGGALQKRRGCCMRLRTHRASPYCVPGSTGDRDWDQIRPWYRKRKDDDEEDDDPHRMLQELILSGNLIKEAVRRLQGPNAADGGPS